MADQKRVNGNLFSSASVAIKVNGILYHGIRSISYGDSIERVKSYGMDRSHRPRGRSSGKYTTEPVVLTVDKDTAEAIRADIANDGDGTLGGSQFPIVVQYSETGLPDMTDTIEQCAYVKSTASTEEGADPLSEDIEFDCMGIVWNGRALYRSET